MDLVSEPDIIEEVTDLDIGFSSGYLEALTLRGADTVNYGADRIVVTKQGQLSVYFLAHIAYYRTKKRVIRTPVKTSPGQIVPADKNMQRLPQTLPGDLQNEIVPEPAKIDWPERGYKVPGYGHGI